VNSSVGRAIVSELFDYLYSLNFDWRGVGNGRERGLLSMTAAGVSTDGMRVLVTPDGKTFIYSFHRKLSDLYMVEGLK
jgi:hypothetical protein